ncbi:hypothetical protein Vretimale_12329 [Volvox reticuliferus]|uniref:Protein kinase domain-containing protein n=1 Tax=Volvox reticuliferus TaxID=1737510 RepID=A0A8J4CBS1_9CHLO|nr:hypothetical protein Vretifemale_8940 [Volvox reticuliferus]GIM08250.1 hypothetical protein Vretimale_12329 [Volvox reticuliferus]
MLLFPSAVVIVPVPLTTTAVLVTMPGDGVAQASTSRPAPAQPNAKRGWNSCSNEPATEVTSTQPKRARVEIFRPGVPARISLSAFRMPDKLSPPLRDDDKDGHFQYELGENLSSRYKILSKMGEGTFGRVLECWDRKQEGYVAIKIVRNIDKYRHAAMIELEVLNTLEKNDPFGQNHCVTLREWFDYRGHVCMVFEKLGLSLFDYMRKNGYKPFPLDLVQDFGRQLLQAVSYMHELRLVHTDLKPENILLTCQESAQPTESSGSSGNGRCCSRPPSSEIKVIDFGSATFEEQYHSCIVSTRHYRAPEVILGLGWSYPCDMWSIGCILIELITGEALFQTHENLEHLAMMEAVLGPVPATMSCKCARTPAGKYFNGGGRLNWPDGASRKSIKAVKRLSGLHQLILAQGDTSARPYATELVDLIGSMLRYEPADRLTAHQALAHPFFATPCVAPQSASRQQQQQGPLAAGLAVAAATTIPRSVPATAVVVAALGAGVLGSTGGTASSAPLPPAQVPAVV